MGKSNKLISFLLCVLIVLSAANLFLSVTNSYRIKQLENAPPVVIEKLTESVILSTEPSGEETTTEESTAPTTEEITAGLTVATSESLTTEMQTSEAPVTEAPSTTEASTAEPTQNNSSICYVTSSGTKYHKDGCSYLKKSKTQMTVSEAKNCGYSPCSRCY